MYHIVSSVPSTHAPRTLKLLATKPWSAKPENKFERTSKNGHKQEKQTSKEESQKKKRRANHGRMLVFGSRLLSTAEITSERYLIQIAIVDMFMVDERMAYVLENYSMKIMLFDHRELIRLGKIVMILHESWRNQFSELLDAFGFVRSTLITCSNIVLNDKSPSALGRIQSCVTR